MIRKKPPVPAELLKRFADFLSELYGVLEASTEIGVGDFIQRGWVFDPYHYSSVVRNEAKNRLQELGASAIRCSVGDLPNNGLLVSHDGHAFKILKSVDGGLPEPHSPSVEGYYEQNLPLALEWFDAEEAVPIPEVNLVVLWVTDEHHRLSELRLVLPGRDGAIWNEAIPHPATASAHAASEPEGETEDLPYERDVADDEESHEKNDKDKG
jgi:hypothetical protein